jgi:hypothetical protein
MSSDPPTDWKNWREQDNPWKGQGPLPQDKKAEVALFKKQDRVRIEREQRRADFEEDIRQRKEAFEQAEVRRHEDLVNPFVYQLWVCYLLWPASDVILPPAVSKHRKDSNENGSSLYLHEFPSASP